MTVLSCAYLHIQHLTMQNANRNSELKLLLSFISYLYSRDSNLVSHDIAYGFTSIYKLV